MGRGRRCMIGVAGVYDGGRRRCMMGGGGSV